MIRSRALPVAGALALLAGLAVALPAPSVAAASASAWRVQPTPNPTVPGGGGMGSVSCFSATTCVAVGNALNSAAVGTAVALVRDGTRWRLQTAPAPAGATASGLSGVSCTAADACTAVGAYTSRTGRVLSMAEQWNGTSWRLQAIPSPAGTGNSRLFTISCTAASACTAVGEYFSSSAGATLPLAERWNGSRWAIQATPSPAGTGPTGLQAVSCTTADACTAVGSTDSPEGIVVTLAEFWNGTSWTIQPSPNPAGATDSGFNAVSCTSPQACTATGSYESDDTTLTLAERWNGTGWTVQPTPNPAETASAVLNGVSCTSARACTTVGIDIGPHEYRALAEQWNGTSWTIQPTPDPGSFDTLSAVSCRSAQACTALGAYNSDSAESLTLAANWNGTRWDLQTTPNPAAAAFSSLVAVSCPSVRACTAVGDYFGAASRFLPLAEARTGARWRIQPTPSPAGATGSYLSGVSCPSPRACTAVGYYASRAGQDRTLAEAWSGTRWRIQPSLGPAGATASQLSAVSCPSRSACTAVGYYVIGGHIKNLAEAWNGTRWRVQPTPSPTRSSLTGVSCTSPRACTAVGSIVPSPGRDRTLAEAWNGVRWRIEPTPTPPGAVSADPSAVSCPDSRHCTLTGDYDTNSAELTLAEAWNGTRWRIQPSPTPGRDNFLTSLPAVSCTSSRACIAVGSYQRLDDGQPTSFAEAWNGTRWLIQSVPTPPRTEGSSLSGASCSPAGTCTAIGSRGFGQRGLTFAVTRSGS